MLPRTLSLLAWSTALYTTGKIFVEFTYRHLGLIRAITEGKYMKGLKPTYVEYTFQQLCASATQTCRLEEKIFCYFSLPLTLASFLAIKHHTLRSTVLYSYRCNTSIIQEIQLAKLN
jgi:hypothetical protein